MSFQDFASSNRNKPATAATGAGSTSSSIAASNVVPRAPSSSPLFPVPSHRSSNINQPQAPRPPPSQQQLSISNNDPHLSQVSEALLQYQRHVGILEKIVQSLTTTFSSSRPGYHEEELNLQYRAQVDVVGQLEDKVRRLLAASNSSSNTGAAAVAVKLQRDFERVQARARVLQDGVKRIEKERRLQQQQRQQQSNAAAAAQQEQETAADDRSFDKLQLQQDRLSEEIMREREAEIRNINRGMHQVNEIYKDLAHLVSTQQDHVDSIETQMEDSKVNAQAGLEQLEKANDKFGASPQCVIS